MALIYSYRKRSKKFDVIAEMIRNAGDAVAGYKTAKAGKAAAAEKARLDAEREDRARRQDDASIASSNDAIRAREEKASKEPYEIRRKMAEDERKANETAQDRSDRLVREARAQANFDRTYGLQKQAADRLDAAAALKANQESDAATKDGREKLDALQIAVKDYLAEQRAGTPGEVRARWPDKAAIPGDPTAGGKAEDFPALMAFIRGRYNLKLGEDSAVTKLIIDNWTNLGLSGDPPKSPTGGGGAIPATTGDPLQDLANWFESELSDSTSAP